MYTPEVADPSPDPERQKRIHRERAMEHAVSLATTTMETRRSSPGFSAPELVAYAHVIAQYLDDGDRPIQPNAQL